MATKTLDINTLTVASPATPPTGYTEPAPASDADIVLTTVKEFKLKAGGTQALWYDNTVMTGALRKAGVVTGTTNGTAVGCGIADASGNGYFYYSNDGNSNSRLYKLAAWVLGTQIGGNITSTHAAGQNREITWETGGVIKLWLNGVQIGTTFNDATTPDPTFACMISRGANLRSLTSEYTPSRTVDTITDPIVLGSAISVGLTGYTAPTSVTGGGMSATGLSFSAGTLTATWPSLSESLAPTVALPATDLTITVTESGGSATITADVNLPAGYVATTFMSAIDDPRYIGGNITLSDGWLAYYDNDQPEVGNIEIQADGRIIADNAGTFTMFLHKFGTGLPLVQYNITINEAGEVVNIGLAAVGLTATGFTAVGLTAVSL